MAEQDWVRRAEAHRQRLAPYVEPHLARRRAGVAHPVHDFLFTYYSQRPAQLMRWHPGYGVGLTGPRASSYIGEKGYPESPSRGVRVTQEHLASQQKLIESIARLLRATQNRAGIFGCFGWHEWAMVYRLGEDQARHAAWPLRLGSAGTDEVVETQRITCSHFDAFRFFTEAARPLNTLQPGRNDRAAFEQPSCLHATMDLYKHAFRLTPLVDSDLVADCFELAWKVRILDMRAAPYDLAGLILDPSGDEWTPVKIETPEGRQTYATMQRQLADGAAPLRQRLIDTCERLLEDVRLDA